MADLLLIDDEPAIRHAFQKVFGGVHAVRVASTAAQALSALANARADVVVLDVHLPDSEGLATFHAVRRLDPLVPVILITGHGTTDLAIEAMKHGAFDYMNKPLELPVLRGQIDRAVRAAAGGPPRVAAAAGETQFVGRSPAMQEVFKAIGRVAVHDMTVLLLGESGTGKELAARAIHQHSQRAAAPFLAINCGAIPETLIESELFGHEKGAFTGADRRRAGKFEQCAGGTLLLDEIAEMPAPAQVRLLRVLQEHEFERVGGNETVRADVRVIAATNADLDAAMTDGRFRADLYFRLNGFSISLPPLRSRGDDIPLLVDHYLRLFERELRKPPAVVAPEAMAALRAYPWPGNVRELQSVLKHSLLQMGGGVLLPDFLPAGVTAPGSGTVPAAPGPAVFDWDAFVAERIAAGTESLHAQAVEQTEREVLVRVLRHTNGNQLQAARILGITRGSLRTKIRALGIAIGGRAVWSADDQPE